MDRIINVSVIRNKDQNEFIGRVVVTKLNENNSRYEYNLASKTSDSLSGVIEDEHFGNAKLLKLMSDIVNSTVSES